MDTKWKNRKKIISFLIFVLGVSMTLGGLTDILRTKPSGAKLWQVDRILEDDYQQNVRFRGYIANRLENFLIMATGGKGLGGIWGYNNGTYYGGGYDGSYYYGDFLEDYWNSYYGPQSTDVRELQEEFYTEEASGLSAWELEDYLYSLREMWDNYLYMLDELEDMDSEQNKYFQEELKDYRDSIEDCWDSLEELQNDRGGYGRGEIKELTEEQKKKIADKYHNNIKGDKNLLYTIAYDGKVLYSNSDALPADGSMSAPEGYNFVLYFDGEKTRILKDGKELDVYGDGFYRDDNDWYVPGYNNFQVDETVKKAAICMAVAKEPVLYMEGSYGNGQSKQYDNALYWMHYNLQARHERLTTEFMCLGAGVLLLILAFFTRKSRREAAEGIARFQSKLWVEAKAVLLLGVLYLLYMTIVMFITRNYGYGWWQEAIYAYEYDGGYDMIGSLGMDILRNAPSFVWIILFWGIYLLVNDLRHNGKIWKNSFIGKITRKFSAKELGRSLSRKMAHRNILIFAAALIYGLVMLGSMIFIGMEAYETIWPLQLLCILATIFFLVLQYIIGSKSMETARDVEALSGRIYEIRSGNYEEDGRKRRNNGIKGNADSTEARRADGTGSTDAGLGMNEPGSAGRFAGRDLEDVMDQLEDIRHGMAKAVDEQMKSERMKVELIANVSHDIKTPLTSIISYVEFLKQEEGLPEHVKDYVKILDEKSQRLKNMVQDVFAVSKAASGELPMHMEMLDFGKLLCQTLADMEEEIDGSPVTFRTDIPKEPVMIVADGQRMYRVFQNLFQNAIKYSLAGSRVYVTLKEEGQMAIASVKNTSQKELDRETEFTERFVRGDQSRTDGGSGLGLSIAQSFTEACGGTFHWETDADLFVVIVSFEKTGMTEVVNYGIDTAEAKAAGAAGMAGADMTGEMD